MSLGPLTLSFTLVFAVRAVAADIPVLPGQSIQTAIDAAAAGDRILVQPGTYFEAIDFKSKAIEVIGVGGPKVTTIDAAGLGSRVVTVPSGTFAARLEGFRITHGTALQGGGIYVGGAGLEIAKCVVSTNSATDGGGLAYVHNQAPGAILKLVDSTFEANTASGTGGGLYLSRQAEVTRCRIVMNTATHGAGIAMTTGSGLTLLAESEISGNIATGNGGGIQLATFPNQIDACRFLGNRAALGGGVYWKTLGTQIFNITTLTSTTFVDNQATTSGGALYIELTSGTFQFASTQLHAQKNTLVGNTAPSFGAIHFIPTSSGFNPPRLDLVSSIAWDSGTNPISIVSGLTVGNSDIQGGFTGSGNIAVDPLFVDLAGRDLHLEFGSPCIDKGVALGGLSNWKLDFERDPIVGATDMGADEYHRHLYTAGTLAVGSVMQLRMIGFPNESVVLLLAASLASNPVPAPPYGSLLLTLPLLPGTPILLSTIGAEGTLSVPAVIRPSLAGTSIAVQCVIGPELTNALLLEF